MKERGRYAAKPVARRSMLVPKALKRFENGVVRHRPLVITLAGKDVRREISKRALLGPGPERRRRPACGSRIQCGDPFETLSTAHAKRVRSLRRCSQSQFDEAFCLLAWGDRVSTFTKKLARLLASPTGRGQRHLRVDASARRFSFGPNRYFSLQYLRPFGVTSRYMPKLSE